MENQQKPTYSAKALQFALTWLVKQSRLPAYWTDQSQCIRACNKAFREALRMDHNSTCVDCSYHDFLDESSSHQLLEHNASVISQERFLFREKYILKEKNHLWESEIYKIPFYSGSQFIGILHVAFTTKLSAAAYNQPASSFTQSNVYLSNIVRNMPGSIYWKDKEGVFLGCNQFVADMAGVSSPEEVIGKSDKELIWKSITDRIRKNDLLIMQSKQEHNFEERIELPDRSKEIIMLTHKAPLFDEQGNVIGVVGISIDITERKKMEEALRKSKIAAEVASRTKTEFIANMSHDIRTPLTGVIGAAEVLIGMLQSDESAEFANIILLSSKRLLTLLNDVLDVIATEEMNEKDIHFETFNLPDCLKGLHELELASAVAKKLDFKLIIDSKLPHYVISDRIKLERILLNLIGNAIKFTHQGSVKLTAKVTKHIKNDFYIKFEITDTGIGIAKDHQFTIFERFSRLTPSYQGKYPGHGIGLYLAKHFVELLGGTIQCKSKVNQGTTFSFTLKLKQGKAEEIEEQSISQEKKWSRTAHSNLLSTQQANNIASNSTDQLRFLLIEDDTIARLLASNILEQTGAQVDSAEDAEKALEMAKLNHYDLIISDVGLPGMSGDEFSTAFRHWEKKWKVPILIIGLTAHANSSVTAQCLAAGMNEVYIKPLTKELVEKLMKTLSNHQATSKTEKDNSTKDSDPTLTEIDLFNIEQHPLFDEQRALEITQDQVILNQLLSILVNTSFPKELTVMQEAYAEKDWETIARSAHTLKGSSLYCGTERLKFACEYVERYVKAGYQKQLEELYQQLLTTIDKTKHYLQSWLEKNQ